VSVVYLTVDQVIEYHNMALAVAPSGEGILSTHQLASAVYQPRQTFGEEDLYPTISEKAAAYGFFIAEGQPFADANKRTASIAMLAFLALNGYEFYQTDEEIEEMFVALGDHTIDQGNFFGWVCNHAKPKPSGNC
jgi:death-on-curing protein